jgi:membrane protein
MSTPFLTWLVRLIHQFNDLRLGQAAASLSFAWLLAMVPLLTVSLALSTSFFELEDIRRNAQQLIYEHFLPQGIGGQLTRYLDQFLRKAASLSLLGFVFLAMTATIMMLTLDKTLNLIWAVDQHRPLLKRILMYWVALLLGPLVAGGGSMLLSVLERRSPELWLDWTNLLVTFLALTLCYRILPNAPVLWRHAAVGAVFAAVLTELGQKFFGGILGAIPTYRQIYGPLAAFPLFLIWTYLTWWLFLLGALIASQMQFMPSAGASMFQKEEKPT